MNDLIPYSASAMRPLHRNLVWLPDKSRNMGIHLMAGKGSGKSRLMGRVIAWSDFLRGVPVVIFDPHGPTIDNFLDKMTRLPQEVQERLWRRVFYVDMSGRSSRIFPFPLYYRLGHEGPFEISQRYLDVLRKLDPHLQTASVEGWNPLWRIGTAAGMILAALGFQITEAEDLVQNAAVWEARLTRAANAQPEIAPAVAVLRDFANLKEEAQSRRSDSFLNKIGLFTFDPTMRAMFGASSQGIDWHRVTHERSAVLLDFRHDHDIERRRFRMVWAFQYFLNFIKHRGAGRHIPISLIVDELTSLFSVETLATDLFASDLDELINVIARNYMVWLTLAHQELFQLDERAQKSLMAMGTQIMGITSDRGSALALAGQFFRYDPYRVKKEEPVYAASRGVTSVIDYHTVEFTMEEQAVLNSYQFSDQGRFHFLVRLSRNEGDMTGALQPMSLSHFDEGLYTNEGLVAQAREILMEKRGRPISEILAEIESRLGDKTPLTLSAHVPADRINVREAPYDRADDDELVFGEKKTAAQSQTGGG